MHATNRPPEPKGVRTSVIFHTVWVTTAALVFFDLSSDRSTLRSFVSPRSAGETVHEQVQASRVFGGKARNLAVDPSKSAHTYFSFGDASGEPISEPSADVENIVLVGQWTGAVETAGVAATWRSGGCDYEIRSLDFQLRTSGNDVFGYGAYTLMSDTCPKAELVTRYASATGKLTAPYLKLNIKNNGSGKTDLVYYGTVQSERIVGHVRSVYGEVLSEHVTLVRR